MPRRESWTSLTLPLARVRTVLPFLPAWSLLPLGADALGSECPAECPVPALSACIPVVALDSLALPLAASALVPRPLADGPPALGLEELAPCAAPPTMLPPPPGLGLAADLDTGLETALCAVCFCADAWGLFATTNVLPTITSPVIIHAAEALFILLRSVDI